MKTITIALALASLAVGGIAQASIRVDARQADQQRRIDAGKRSGKLSRAERDRLTAEQRMIAGLEARLKARHGGRLTRADDARLMMMLDRSDRHIIGLKHNGRRGRNGIHI